MRPKAVIIGAGIAGLSAAIALRKADYDVSVYEQSPFIAPIGAALSLWANAMAALQWLGVADRIASEAAPIRRVDACTRSGRSLTRIDFVRAYGDSLPTPRLPTRALLQDVLLAGLGDAPLHLGMKLAHVSQTKNEASAQFEDGSSATADLVVIADGIWSEAADALIGNPARHAGYGGVLALSEPVAGVVDPGCASEYSVPGERFGFFDIGGDRAYWFYMRTEASPDESKRLRRSDIEERLPGWPSALSAAVLATPADRLIPFSIHAKPAPRRLGRARIICVGDAAHAMQPNFGQGGCQALEDAVALGAVAQVKRPDQILPLFEALRLKRIAMFVNGSRAAALVSQSGNWIAPFARAAAWSVPNTIVTKRVAAMHRLPNYEEIAGGAS